MAVKSETREDYDESARDDALNIVERVIDNITDALVANGGASTNLYEYPRGDEYHHEVHMDRDYSLSEASDVLDDLSGHEETDSGLWQGLEPRRAIVTQAAYTYANAVMHYFQVCIAAINDDATDGILGDMLDADNADMPTDERATTQAVRERALEVAREAV